MHAFSTICILYCQLLIPNVLYRFSVFQNFSSLSGICCKVLLHNSYSNWLIRIMTWRIKDIDFRNRGASWLLKFMNQAIFWKENNSRSVLCCLVRVAAMWGVCERENDNEGNGRTASVKAPVISHQSHFTWLSGANGPQPHWQQRYWLKSPELLPSASAFH